MAKTLDAFSRPALLDPSRRRETLERRLEDGYRRIGDAEASGRDIAGWEAFWIELLHEYEAVCDGLPEAA